MGLLDDVRPQGSNIGIRVQEELMVVVQLIEPHREGGVLIRVWGLCLCSSGSWVLLSSKEIMRLLVVSCRPR